MARAIVWRILATIPTLVGVVCIVFLVVHLIPGDPVQAMLGERATAGQVAEVRSELGLDRPLGEQFLEFGGSYLQGDFGRSLTTRTPVARQIGARLVPTLNLAATGMIIAVILGVPIGIYGATRRGRLGDIGSQVASTIGIAAPPFWIGLILVLFFAVRYNWFPSIGAGAAGDWSSVARSLVLPGLALGLPATALVARMTRSSTLDVLSEDYVRTAYAKGLSDGVVLMRHVLRNAAIPILTIVAINFGNLLGGAIAVESVFARPGLGTLLLDGILMRDYPIVQGVAFVIAGGFILVNLLTDLLYLVIDPRVGR